MRKVKHPQLLLYTWNHDPSTNAEKDLALQDHRLGIYDWMQKCHNVMVWLFMNTAYDLALLYEDSQNDGRPESEMSHMANPGKATNGPQMMTSLFEMIGPIGSYPFNQVDKNDPELVQKSLENPDDRYFALWYTWVMELFTKAIRVFHSYTWAASPLLNAPIVSFYER